MEDEELNQIALDYLERLPNRDAAQDSFMVDKLAVCFAGIPGSGKTRLSMLIEEKRNALRISSSEIRDDIRSEYPEASDEEVNEAKDKVLEDLVELLNDEPNKLLVLDMSLDRKYERIDSLLESNGYQTLVISLEVEVDEAKDRVRNREPNFEEYEPHFNKWTEQHEQFLANYDPDLNINALAPDDEAVFQLIDRDLHNEKGNEPEPMDDIDESSSHQKPTQAQP